METNNQYQSSYKAVKVNDMQLGKIYYHYSSRFNNCKWVRLVDKLGNSDHFSCVVTEKLNVLMNNDLFDKYVNMDWSDRIEFDMKKDEEPFGVLSDRFGLNTSEISDLSYYRFNQPRKEFYDSNILLEVLDFDKFPFSVIYCDNNWVKDYACRVLSKSDLRDLKIQSLGIY